MKKIMLVTVVLSSISATAYATNNGFYVGLQGGYGDIGQFSNNSFPSAKDNMDAINDTLVNDNNANNIVDIWNATLSPTASTSSTTTNGGFAARFFGGYQFTPYFALETGYIYLSQDITNTQTTTGAGYVTQPGFLALFPTTSAANAAISVTNKLTEKVVDLVAKFSYPLQDTNFSPYVKAGVAYVYPTLTTTVNSASVNIQNVNPSTVNVNQNRIEDDLENKGPSSAVCPEGAVGINYDINENFSVDASWTFIKGVNDIQNINFASIGLIVHFA